MNTVSELIGMLLTPLIENGLLARTSIAVTLSADGRALADALEEAAGTMAGRLSLEIDTRPAPGLDVLAVTVRAWIHDGSAERDVAAAFLEAYARDEGTVLLGSRGGQPVAERVRGSRTREIAWTLDSETSQLEITAAADHPPREG